MTPGFQRPPAVLIVLAIVFLAQAIILGAIRSGTSFDGAEQLLYTQYFEWGYGRSQPPLYTWLLIGMQQVFGVTQLAENLLKFAFLFVGFAGLHAIAIRLGASAIIAAVVALSAFLVVEIGWEAQRNYAHSVQLFAAGTMLAWLYLVTLNRAGSVWHHIGMGVLCGILLLSKYNSVLFIAALVAADLSLPQARVFARRASLLVWLVAVAVAAPHLIWAAGNFEAVTALADGFIGPDDSGVALSVLNGLWLYLVANLNVLAPVAIVVSGVTLFARGPRLAPHMSTERAVMLRWAIALWLIGLIVTLVSGTTEVRGRWLLVLLVPLLPVLWIWVLQGRPRATRVVLGICAGFGVLSVAGQWWESTRGNPRTDFDYAALVQALEAAALPRDLIVADYAVFANLRLYGPRAVANTSMPDPARVIQEQATLIWTGGRENQAIEVRELADQLGLCPGQTAPLSLHMPRRHTDGGIDVQAQVVTRAACAPER